MKKSKPFNLRSFILNGIPTPVEKVSAEEVKAGDEANVLEKEIDFIKALKIKEAKLDLKHKILVREMRKVQSAKRTLKKRILKKI